MTFVSYEVKGRIGYITLCRPEKRNALNSEFVNELKKAFSKAEEDKAAKVIILKAEGDVFCAGADLEYLQQLQKNSYEENLMDSTNLMELYKQIYTLKKVVIAQVNGHAIAGGAGLVSVCDFAFSIPQATFGYTEVKIGFIPAIVMVFLNRKIGGAKTKELLLSGNIIQAEEAKNIGLINFLVNADELEKAVLDYAEKLSNQNSSTSMEMTKKMLVEINDLNFEEALKHASQMNAKARATEDCKRGIEAFLKKEKINW